MEKPRNSGKDRASGLDSSELERGVLGAMVYSRTYLVEYFRRAKRDWFSLEPHRVIFGVLTDGCEKPDCEDRCLEWLFHILTNLRLLEKVGGATYVSSLTDCAALGFGVGYAAEQLENFWARRQLVMLLTRTVVDCED